MGSPRHHGLPFLMTASSPPVSIWRRESCFTSADSQRRSLTLLVRLILRFEGQGSTRLAIGIRASQFHGKGMVGRPHRLAINICPECSPVVNLRSLLQPRLAPLYNGRGFKAAEGDRDMRSRHVFCKHVFGAWGWIAAGILVLPGTLGSAAQAQSPATGPLRRLESNPRYFTDGSGKAILLVGSHNWRNFQDNGHRLPGGPGPAAGLRLRRLSRLPREAQPQLLPPLAVGGAEVDRRPAGGDHQVLPAPSLGADRPGHGGRRQAEVRPRRRSTRRTSTGCGSGSPRPRARGIYVSIMLFEGWEIQFTDAWKYHPFHGPNNVNGIDADPERQGPALQPAPRRPDGQEGAGLAGGLPAQGDRHGERPGQRALRDLQRDRGVRRWPGNITSSISSTSTRRASRSSTRWG